MIEMINKIKLRESEVMICSCGSFGEAVPMVATISD